MCRTVCDSRNAAPKRRIATESSWSQTRYGRSTNIRWPVDLGKGVQIGGLETPWLFQDLLASDRFRPSEQTQGVALYFSASPFYLISNARLLHRRILPLSCPSQAQQRPRVVPRPPRGI